MRSPIQAGGFISIRPHSLFSTDTRSIYSDQNSIRKISMATTPQLRVLFFDVFVTCVAQRTPVADELWRAAREALESDVSSISSEVRTKATKMVCPSQLSTPIKYKLISFAVIRAVVRVRRGRWLTK
jgi:hypothetical protein